jgi:hypothetical protein
MQLIIGKYKMAVFMLKPAFTPARNDMNDATAYIRRL